jgi:hypothetical protein
MVEVAVAASFETTTAVVRRRGAILVVEDRDDVRQGLAQLLEMHGFPRRGCAHR